MDLKFDEPAVQEASCAFTGAAENDVYGEFSGHAPVDLGHGQVGQKFIQIRSVCGGPFETLIVFDCDDGDVAGFAGSIDPVFAPPTKRIPMSGPARATYTKNIQPPHGPIRLGRGTELSKLQALAAQYDMGQYASLSELSMGERPRNRVDFWCGCKRYYPSSAGAKL